RAVVVEAQGVQAVHDAGRRAARTHGRRSDGRRSARHFDGEHAAAPGPRAHAEPMTEHACDTLANRQAEAQAFFAPWRGMIESLELVEDRLEMLRCDARPRVPDLDRD